MQRAADNYRLCKSKINKKIIAVVKANAYGHGANEISLRLMREGCRSFAVSNVTEAVNLRRAGVEGEIIILGYVMPFEARALKEYALTAVIYDESSYNIISESNVKLPVYLKIDTGMRRLGFNSGDYKILQKIMLADGVDVKGLFTHFSCADTLRGEDLEYTSRQAESFCEIADRLNKISHRKLPLYACAGAGAARLKEELYDGVRIGISLYGIKASDEVFETDILPVMTLKSVISTVKTIENADFVSYGRTYAADKTIKTAVVSAGYADGYNRALSNKGRILVNGKYARVLGNVTMDQTVIDVSEINAETGDEVILFGGGGQSVGEVARTCDTIPYEIVCGISARVIRVFTENGKTVSIRDNTF